MVTVVDKKPAFAEESVLAVRQISGDLFHPAPVGLADDTRDLDSARFEVDHEENEVPNQPRPRENLHAEEVGCCDHAPVCFEECLPRRLPVRCWFKTVPYEDPLDRVAPDLMIEIPKCSPDSGVAPTRVVLCHPENQLREFSRCLRSPNTSNSTAVVLPRD